jgi:carbamoyl-phosphate synthase large subunit
MESLNVVITGSGAPGIAGTVFSLRNQSEYALKLVGTDIDKDNVGSCLLDKNYNVSTPSQEFIDEIIDICEKENIGFILPQVTKELKWFAKYKKRIENLGINVLVQDSAVLEILNNKHELLDFCQKEGIDCTGEYYLINSLDELEENARLLGYPKKPFVVKVPDANGMRGLRIINSKFDPSHNFLTQKPDNATTNLENFKNIFLGEKIPTLLMMEYYPGEEYSVDVLADDGVLVACVPRIRERIRSGITFQSLTKNNAEIISIVKRIVSELRIDNIVGFQFKLSKDGKPMIIECNPRIQGTMVASTLAGANIVYGAIRKHLKGDSMIKQDQITWDSKFFRYWGGISKEGRI